MIAGPCSAESEAQMLETARRIKESNANVSVFVQESGNPVQNLTDLKE
jgi:3-deoxy-D-arabino-heptulosonate 7-phosphate (DAHP) synthase